MCTPQTRRERIFLRWDATDSHTQRMIFNEFKMKHQGCYSQRDLLNFLEKKLMQTPETAANSINYCRTPFCLSS